MRVKRKRQEHMEEALEDHSESNDDSDDYVDDLPEAELKKKQEGPGRCSVSSEAYGRYYKKEDFQPIYHEKSGEAIQQIRDKLEESFMFSALDEKEKQIVVDAIQVQDV